jgi:hypothetical protein
MRTGLPVGYAPDYLVDTIHLLRECDSRSVTSWWSTSTAPRPHLTCACCAGSAHRGRMDSSPYRGLTSSRSSINNCGIGGGRA